MYISLIDLDFLLWSAWNCKNCIFSDNLRTITEDGIIKTRQFIPFFHLLFALKLLVTFTSEFKNIQNSFSCAPRFGPFCSVKYLNFWPKATDLDSSPYFYLLFYSLLTGRWHQVTVRFLMITRQTRYKLTKTDFMG